MLFDFLGFLFFSFLFLLFMVVAGFWGLSFYIKRKVSQYEQSQTQSHNLFVYLLVNILVKIAQIDGTVTKEESNAIVNFFRQQLHYNQSQIYWVKDLMKQALESTAGLDSLITEFKQHFAYEPRLILLQLIYQVLYTNPQVSPEELELVQRIVDFLDISAYDHLSIRSRFVAGAAHSGRQGDDSRHFETLGLTPGADFNQVKNAYRKLSMKYHPDKVGHLGEEFRQVAEEKMKEINVAYQHLKEKFGE